MSNLKEEDIITFSDVFVVVVVVDILSFELKLKYYKYYFFKEKLLKIYLILK